METKGKLYREVLAETADLGWNLEDGGYGDESMDCWVLKQKFLGSEFVTPIICGRDARDFIGKIEAYSAIGMEGMDEEEVSNREGDVVEAAILHAMALRDLADTLRTKFTLEE